MRARLLRLLQDIAGAFWVLPAGIVIVLAGAGVLVVDIQIQESAPGWIKSDWLYGGGDTGARTLLGAIASSTIAVAGTLFSITIAALTLASRQMGPRLLRNFMRDRGNQVTLGVLLGSFAYALIVLRSVRGGEETAFVPALGVTLGLGLAAACIGLMIYFVHHIASRINVDTVIDLVYDDIVADMARLAVEAAPRRLEDGINWDDAMSVHQPHSGYLQQIDTSALVDWAAKHDCVVKLTRGPGEFVYPYAQIALISKPIEDAEAAIWDRIALSPNGGSPEDITFPITQLVEVAVRALSAGVNDPGTAIGVLDRMGAVLASLSRRHLPSGIYERDGVVRLRVPALTYSALAAAMFDKIRQSAGHSPAALIHLVRVLTEVSAVERCSQRRMVIEQFVLTAVEHGRKTFVADADTNQLMQARAHFFSVIRRPAPLH